MSQATVTRTIQALERHYGVELLRRSTRDMALTEAGQALLEGGVKLLESASSLWSRVSADDGQLLQGRLRVTAPSGLGTRVIAPLAARFAHTHPGMMLDLLCTDRYLDLVAENIDLAVRVGDLETSNLVQRVLGRLPEVLVGAPAYLDVLPPLAEPQELASHAFVGLSILRGPAQALRLTSSRGETTTLRPRSAIAFDTPMAVRECLLAGGGIGRIHRYLVADDLATGRLRQVLLGWSCPTWTVSLVKTARPRTRAADAFIDALVAALATTAGVQAG